MRDGSTRRAFVTSCASFLAAGAEHNIARPRRYHVSLSPDTIEADVELLRIVQAGGVSDVWITGFLYGHWYYTPETIARTLKKIRDAGMAAHVINLPLGHPGDALGAVAGAPPLTPPEHWKKGVLLDGRTRWGVSLHAPATAENVAALRRLRRLGADRAFLDDDFRLAPSPGAVGGCFCAQHMQEFQNIHGYGPSVRDDLAADLRTRQLTRRTRAWVDFWCARLGACFRAQQSAVPHLPLGLMVMYLGAEKAGIRLPDYTGVPFRVGELMFNDASFHPVKGKTDELFSVLFHRRFAAPPLAFSETTAFPAHQLSAPNMAAKLATSTLADVRHTMYMSGLRPFPRGHWETLAPAMKKHAAVHSVLAGHTLRGPFKHFWGEHSRYVGDDRPYSLFLAAGVPFEVTGSPAAEGWTFLSAADRAADLRPAGTQFVSTREVPESLPDLFRLKPLVREQFPHVPVVLEEKPVVCGWYPTARAVLLWNLSESVETLTIAWAASQRRVTVGALDICLLQQIG